jgi:hypothetical protein
MNRGTEHKAITPGHRTIRKGEGGYSKVRSPSINIKELFERE